MRSIATGAILVLLGSLGFSSARAQGVGETPLAARVEESIDRGAAYLAQSFDPENLGPVMGGYPLGSRALIAYALLESGVPTEDPGIVKLFGDMQEQPLEKVYGVSLYVLALHAWKVRSVPLHVSSSTTSVVGTALLPGDRRVSDEIARCVDWLLKVRRPGHGTWGYGELLSARDLWVDFSNTQFAALALHVGLLEGVKIPTRVFEEMVNTLSKNVYAGDGEIGIDVDRAPWLDDKVEEEEGVSRGGVRLNGRPLSWGYRMLTARQRQGLGRASGAWGTTSMTAVAVSTLLVAEHGLDSGRLKKKKLKSGIDMMVTGGIIELSRAWHPARERDRGSLHRNIYYTLYSLEKALDLAGVGILDGTDWYRAQVPHLLDDQLGNGSWGGNERLKNTEYSLTSTAFALLFLRRATASLTVHAAAPIITHSGGGRSAGSDPSTGRVWVESLGGAIDLNELFDRLREDRTGRMFASAREVIAAVPPSVRPVLLRWLLPLFAGDLPIATQQFSRRESATITGLAPEAQSDRYAEWIVKWERLRELATVDASDAHVAEIKAIVTEPALGVPLRSEGIVALRRTGSMDAVPILLSTLEDPELAIRRAGARSLRFLTSESFPFDPEASVDERSASLAGWREWWETSGEELRVERTFERLKQRLDRAEDPEERAQLRADLVALGAVIVPRVERIVQGGSYAFDWILVRQALTGEVGIR